MLEGDVMGNEIGSDELVGVVIGLSAATVVAICSAIIAWLKWRHPPKDG